MNENVTMIVPPNVIGMMCGVLYARIFPSGFVELTYTDYNTESAYLTLEQLTAGRDNFFSLVSTVQSFRLGVA